MKDIIFSKNKSYEREMAIRWEQSRFIEKSGVNRRLFDSTVGEPRRIKRK